MEQTLLGKVIVVDTIEKFETLKEGVKKTPFLYLQIYSDINIKGYYSNEKYQTRVLQFA